MSAQRCKIWLGKVRVRLEGVLRLLPWLLVFNLSAKCTCFLQEVPSAAEAWPALCSVHPAFPRSLTLGSSTVPPKRLSFRARSTTRPQRIYLGPRKKTNRTSVFLPPPQLFEVISLIPLILLPRYPRITKLGLSNKLWPSVLFYAHPLLTTGFFA